VGPSIRSQPAENATLERTYVPKDPAFAADVQDALASLDISPHPALEAFWIFGKCKAGQYKHKLFGCRNCPKGCGACSGSLFGGGSCTTCSVGVLQKDNSCFSCADETQYIQKGKGAVENVCLYCNKRTLNCRTCENYSHKCKTCDAPFSLDSKFQCGCPTGQVLIVATNKCEVPADCADAKYADNTNTC